MDGAEPEAAVKSSTARDNLYPGIEREKIPQKMTGILEKIRYSCATASNSGVPATCLRCQVERMAT